MVILLRKQLGNMQLRVNLKLQLPILSQQGIEGIAKLNGASGGYMLHDCRMKGHGRYCRNLINLHEQIVFCLCTDFFVPFLQIKKYLIHTLVKAQGKLKKTAWQAIIG
jgi:hypothetical protein